MEGTRDPMRERQRRSQKEVKKELEQILSGSFDDEALRSRLEQLAREYAFDGLTPLWGPALYRRNKIKFRPFILSHFASWAFIKKWTWKPVSWKKYSEELEAWLTEVDREGDVELFRRLWDWRELYLTPNYKKRAQSWGRQLLERFQRAGDSQGRQMALAKFDTHYSLDETTALALYEIDANLAPAFILRHLPVNYSLWGGEKRELWRKLYDRARGENEDLALQLYRRQVPLKEWEKDALAAAGRLRDGAELCAELRRIQPEGHGVDLGPGFLALLKSRGEEVLPYVSSELRKVSRGWLFRTAFDDMIDLSREQGWWELWAGLVRVVGSAKTFNQQVYALVHDGVQSADKIVHRLKLLSGVSKEWNMGALGIAAVRPLDDKTATALYKRFPDLLRGYFRANINPNWSNAYSDFFDTVMRANDETVLDFLAARVITASGEWDWQKSQVKMAEKLAAYYEERLGQPEVFAHRACAVLGQVPPYSIYNYNATVRGNPLARLLYERHRQAYLEHPRAFTDLMEAPEIHAQALAYRLLAEGGETAEARASENLELLLATLLRPLHRKTRLWAMRALETAAADPESAARVHTRARQALRMPERGYPKEELVALLARLLYRWPELRRERERPVVYSCS